VINDTTYICCLSQLPASREVTVETPEGSDESIITTQPVATDAGTGNATAAPGAAGADGAADADGEVAGESIDSNGEVSDDAAVTQNTEGEVLSDKADEADDSNFWNAIVAVVLLGTTGYYWFFYRNGRVNPFAARDDQ